MRGKQPCHYETLGVSKDASLDEIKAAFRKLSMETHPDVAGVCANPERFKDISHAASVLTNKVHKQAYDQRMADIAAAARSPYSTTSPFSPSGRPDFYASIRRARDPATRKQSPSGLTAVLVSMFRPRNMILGPVALFATVSAVQYALGNDMDNSNRHAAGEDVVQAWKNPSTGEYETPAPWDPVFRQLNPTLEYVPKDQVRARSR